MSDQDLATQVEQLRTQQEQTDQSLIALADAVEDLIEEAEGSELSEAALRGVFMSARQAVAAVKRNHQSNQGR
jgi:regulator of replication initiation timing